MAEGDCRFRVKHVDAMVLTRKPFARVYDYPFNCRGNGDHAFCMLAEKEKREGDGDVIEVVQVSPCPRMLKKILNGRIGK